MPRVSVRCVLNLRVMSNNRCLRMPLTARPTGMFSLSMAISTVCLCGQLTLVGSLETCAQARGAQVDAFELERTIACSRRHLSSSDDGANAAFPTGVPVLPGPSARAFALLASARVSAATGPLPFPLILSSNCFPCFFHSCRCNAGTQTGLTQMLQSWIGQQRP